MYNILGGLSSALTTLRTIWNEVITIIKETDYLMVCLIATLLLIGFRLLMAARGAAGSSDNDKGV